MHRTHRSRSPLAPSPAARPRIAAAFVVALLAAAGGATATRPTSHVAAQPPGPPRGVAAVGVRDDRVVAIVDDQMVALVLGEPRSLVAVGRVGLAPPPTKGYGLAFHPDGTFAAVADSSGVALVRFAPEVPPVITRVEGDLLDVQARAVAFAGRTLVTLAIRLWEGSAGEPVDFVLRTYDVSDAHAPHRIGEMTWKRSTGSGASLAGFAATERAAYIGLNWSWGAGRGGSVQIVDLGDPSAPRPLPSFATGAFLRHLAVDGPSLWAAMDDGLQRYDTADLANPAAFGWLALNAPPVRVAASGQGLWTATGGTQAPLGRLIGVDVADPTHPRLAPNSSKDLIAEPRALAAAGDRLVYGDAAGHVELMSVGDPPGWWRWAAGWPDVDGRPRAFATTTSPTVTPMAVMTPRPTLDPTVFIGRVWLPALLSGASSR